MAKEMGPIVLDPGLLTGDPKRPLVLGRNSPLDAGQFLATELKSLGYSVGPRADALRMLDVSIADWNFDGMMDGKFWYELRARVLGADGKLLASSDVKDSQFIEGSIWTGAKAGFEAKMPELYSAAIRKLVRENPTIKEALKSGARTQ